MISSISNQSSWIYDYQNLSTESLTKDLSSYEVESTEVQAINESDSSDSSETYSTEEHMKMMKGKKPMGPPPGGGKRPPKNEGVSDSDTDSDYTTYTYNASTAMNQYVFNAISAYQMSKTSVDSQIQTTINSII